MVIIFHLRGESMNELFRLRNVDTTWERIDELHNKRAEIDQELDMIQRQRDEVASKEFADMQKRYHESMKNLPPISVRW